MLYSRNFEAPQPNPPVRHRCRNPRCGVRLKPAVTNSRDAFCCEGCFTAFYRRHCLVCERPIIRQTERQILCGRKKCRNDFQRHKERFYPTRYPASVLRQNALGSAQSTGLKIGTSTGREFVQIAGPKLSPTSLRLASLPLDPELAARLERARRPDVEALVIKRKVSPANVLGGYRFPGAPEVDLSPLPAAEWAVPSRWKPAAAATDCPDIPNFLLRKSVNQKEETMPIPKRKTT